MPSVFKFCVLCLWAWSYVFIIRIPHVISDVQFFHLRECSVFVPSYYLLNISVGKPLSNSNYVAGWLWHRIGMVERIGEGLWGLLRGGLFALCLWHLNCLDTGVEGGGLVMGSWGTGKGDLSCWPGWINCSTQSKQPPFFLPNFLFDILLIHLFITRAIATFFLLWALDENTHGMSGKKVTYCILHSI